jgi:hypothetical protein
MPWIQHQEAGFPMEFMLRTYLLSVVLLTAPFLSGCSSQQVYGMGQAWQRNECYKIVDAQEHNRCLASTSMSYDEYRRRIEATKDAK